MNKLYAQIDENNICICIGTPKTNIPVDNYNYLGWAYENNKWINPEEKAIEDENVVNIQKYCPICSEPISGNICEFCGHDINE